MEHQKNICKLVEVIAKDAADTNHKQIIDSVKSVQEKIATLKGVKANSAALKIVC